MNLIRKIIRRLGLEIYDTLEFVTSCIPGSLGKVARRLFYSLYLSDLGSNALIGTGVQISSPENIHIGANFIALRHCSLGATNGGRLEMGDGVSLSTNVILDAGEHGLIRLGKDVGIGPNCVLRSSAHNYSDPDRPFKTQGHTPGTIILEDDVWLAASVILLPGTHLEKGCVIASGSVVSGVVKAYTVVAGNPARVVSRRGTPSGTSPSHAISRS